MKRLLFITLIALFICNNTSAQMSTQDKMKKRAELLKMNKKLQAADIDDATKDQAKEMKKEGWKVAPGHLPLEQQISRSVLLQNQFEDDLVTPKYVWGDATSIAENYDGGKMQALELARINLVSSIESNITQIVETNRDNQQLSEGSAATIIKSLGTAKSYISQKIGQTITVIDTYRDRPNNNVEVRVMIFYSMDKAKKLTHDAVRKQLEKDGQSISDEELDKLMGGK